MKRYDQGFWSVDFPEEWNIQTEDDAPVAFYEDDTDWAIQISYYLKESEAVNNSDLQKFIGDLEKPGCMKKTIITPHAQGLLVEFTDEENILQRHILIRSGHIMLYITYNADMDGQQLNEGIFHQFIESIEINGEQVI